MSSSLSSILADIVLQNLEKETLRRLNIDISFYYWYVNDVAIAVPHGMIDNVLKVFNSFHDKIQFTLEIGGDNLIF